MHKFRHEQHLTDGNLVISTDIHYFYHMQMDVRTVQFQLYCEHSNNVLLMYSFIAEDEVGGGAVFSYLEVVVDGAT